MMLIQAVAVLGQSLNTLTKWENNMQVENIMTGDQLDDGSLVINFDQQDDNGICNTGGYVIVRQEEEGFIITAIDGQGDVVNEYVMSYHVAYNGD
jgi:hypothetical protein